MGIYNYAVVIDNYHQTSVISYTKINYTVAIY